MPSAPDVEGLPRDDAGVRMNDRVKSFAVILHEEPVTRGRSVTVHGKRLVEQAARDEPRHSLLEMLSWPVIVERPHDYRWNAVGRPIRVDETIGATLRGGVRAHRIERVILVHR